MVLNFVCRICSFIAPGVGNDALLSLNSILRIKKKNTHRKRHYPYNGVK